MELRDLINALMRRLWLLMAGMLLAMVASYLALRLLTPWPRYQATATVLIGTDSELDLAALQVSRDLAPTYVEWAQRRAVLQNVIDSLRLPWSFEELQSHISVQAIRDTQLMEISATSVDPEQAALIANEVAWQLTKQPLPIVRGGDETQLSLQSDVSMLRSRIQAAEAELADLGSRLSAAESEEDVDALTSRIDAVQRNLQVWRRSYTELDTAYTDYLDSFIVVAEKAVVPSQPVSPWINVFVAGITGLVIASGLALFLEYLDNTVKPTGDGVEDLRVPALGKIPVLGVVPHMVGGRCETSSAQAEMIRQLRTKVMLSTPGGHLKSLLVASPQPGDGRTVTVANLAVAMAGSGARVVLVDADLRRPALHEWFDQPNLAGLADLLGAHEAHIDQLLSHMLRDTYVSDLSLLSAGHLPLDPLKLLASPNMRALLERLSDQFDVVLLDSPPVLLTPDATILATLTQGTLLVLSPSKTSREAARYAGEQLQSRQDIRIIGVALNRMSLERGIYQYRHYLEAMLQQVYRVPQVQKLRASLPDLPWISRPEDPDLISVTRAAEILGVRSGTVNRWCQEGRLPAVKRALRWWIRQDELHGTLLDTFMANGSSDLALVASSDGRSLPDSFFQRLLDLVDDTSEPELVEETAVQAEKAELREAA